MGREPESPQRRCQALQAIGQFHRCRGQGHERGCRHHHDQPRHQEAPEAQPLYRNRLLDNGEVQDHSARRHQRVEEEGEEEEPAKGPQISEQQDGRQAREGDGSPHGGPEHGDGKQFVGRYGSRHQCHGTEEFGARVESVDGRLGAHVLPQGDVLEDWHVTQRPT